MAAGLNKTPTAMATTYLKSPDFKELQHTVSETFLNHSLPISRLNQLVWFC
jgi:hypothetical protein